MSTYWPSSINPPFNWCASNPKINVTYDISSIKFIDVTSNKSIIGVGANASIQGRGLRLVGDNIIVRNIHFTELNRQYVWGGDGIFITRSDWIWIDHCKFSHIGRQLLVIADTARGEGRISITNNDFDGMTDHSSTCNGYHYYSLYFTGVNYNITFSGNYIHTTSGRGPKVGEAGVPNDLFLHAVGNYWYDVSWHAFDTYMNSGLSLIEGNYFEKVGSPRLHDDNHEAFIPVNSASQCVPYLGRNCEANLFVNSGTVTGSTSGRVNKLAGLKLAKPISAIFVKAAVLASAGVGKI